MIPPMLYLVLLYIVIILMGNQMLSATVEEKENRVTEMILTTIRAKTLLVGKVISLFIIGFVQMVAFAIPVGIAYAGFRDRLNIPNLDLSALQFQAGPMIIGALLLVGSFALFTATLVAIGAAMPTVKDASPFFAGMVITLFLPIYAMSLIITSPQVPIVQVFTFFPYTAPVTALVRNALGSLPLWAAMVDIVVLYGLSAVVLQIAVRNLQVRLDRVRQEGVAQGCSRHARRSLGASLHVRYPPRACHTSRRRPRIAFTTASTCAHDSASLTLKRRA